MFFQFPLEQSTQVGVLGERLSNVQIEKLDQLLECLTFLSFQVPIKIVKYCNFLGLFFIIVSVLSVFLDLNLQKKPIMNAV